MKWLLLLTILSGYSGSSTVAANFDSKEPCEAAAKSQEQAYGNSTGTHLRLYGLAVPQLPPKRNP